MNAQRMSTLAMIGGLALAAAAPVMADDDRRYGSGNPEWSRSREFERRQARVQSLAHEIDLLADRIARGTIGARYVHSPYQVQAQRQLRSLSVAADRFHDQVERRRSNFRATLADYRVLRRNFERAEDSFDALRAPRPMRRDFRRLEMRMAELNDLFEDRWNGHDERRYDRDGFEDDRPGGRGGSGR